MDLPTYTNIWRIEKRLYKLYDFRLPTPLPVVTLGVYLGVCITWFALMGLLRIPSPLESPWQVVWLVPPFLITWAATRPVIEGKRLTELLLSYGRFVTEARVYTRLAPEGEAGQVTVTVRVWHRHPAAGPLPAVRTKAVKKRAKKGAKKGATELSGPPAEPAPALDAAPTSGPRELERVREGRRAEAARNAAARGTPVASAAPAPPLTHAPEPEENESEPYFGPPPLDRREHTEANGTRHERPEDYERREPDAAPEPEPAQETRGPATPTIVPPAASGTESPREEPAAPAAATRSGPAPPQPAAPPAARTGEESPAGHDSEPEPDREHADTRGIGVKILNYFGFALHRMPGQPEAGRKGRRGAAPAPDVPTRGRETRSVSRSRKSSRYRRSPRRPTSSARKRSGSAACAPPRDTPRGRCRPKPPTRPPTPALWPRRIPTTPRAPAKAPRTAPPWRAGTPKR